MIDYFESFKVIAQSAEVLLIVEWMLCGLFVLGADRFFGLPGLYVYTAVGVIVANITVLKVVQFSFYPNPMALGTVVFSSLFLASDIMNERYGKKAALKSVGLGFFAYFVTMVLMGLSLLYGASSSVTFDSAVSFLIMPAPSLFLASLVSYFCSQYMDVFLYDLIHSKTGPKLLWLRSFISTLVAVFIDNTIFSLLAWSLLTLSPLPLSDIFWTYILGATVLRVVVSLGNVAFMYASAFLNRNNNPHVVSLS